MPLVAPTLLEFIRVAQYVVKIRFLLIAIAFIVIFLNAIISGFNLFSAQLLIYLAVFVAAYNLLLLIIIRKVAKDPTRAVEKWYTNPHNLLFISYLLDVIAVNIAILSHSKVGQIGRAHV